MPQQPHGLPSLVSATDSGNNDREEIEEYVKSIKKRAQESSRIGSSSSSTQDRRPELWTLPVPVRFFHVVLDPVAENILQPGMEAILAGSLSEISLKMHGDSGISTYHIPYLPRRIYIEAPGIAEIQALMKFSAYGHLVSRASRVLDDLDRNFLHSTRVPDVPCIGSWVRIIQPGLYKGDLGLVFSTPSTGDIVVIAVIPRFRTKKRKGKGNARPASALLDPKFLATFYPPNEENIHLIGSREFSSNGLEFLRAASAHALKTEPRPAEAELVVFRSSFGILDKRYQLDAIIHYAMNKAFRNESRRLWRTGDRVKILEGAFVDRLCSIREIDKDNRSVIVEFDSPKPTTLEVSLEDVERQFLVGDQVRVALGQNKERMGSILKINDGVGTIVEGTANQVIEVSLSLHSFSFIIYFAQFQSPLLYLESYDLPPSFAYTPHPAASSMSKPSHESEAWEGHQMLGRRDPRIGREAAVYVGPMKGYQGRLIDIGRNFAKIECPGRQLPTYSAPLKYFVLM